MSTASRPAAVRQPDFDTAAAHAAAVLRDWPDGAPVRLAKTTSNLFRARSDATQRLELSAFSGVYDVDPVRRVATVGGLTTYEDLVDATLPHGLVPLCVPQLRTISVGGAVTGLGIEAASFRNGCPHESVLAMDVLAGTGEVVRAEPAGRHRDLFYGFANSYGTFGYALRLEIELEPVTPQIRLRHTGFGRIEEAAGAISDVVERREWHGTPVDYLDGTVFGPDECYLTTAHYTDEEGDPSDYTSMDVYYQSIRRRRSDLLTTHDYLWRWDTDWFWCSRALGAQHPLVRRLWPKAKLRSDVYWKIVAFDRRHQLANRWARLRHRPQHEAVVQDVELPVGALPAFMDFFHREVGMSPVWLCPLKQRDPAAVWPLYQFDPDTTYVNVGFWGGVDVPDGTNPLAGTVNRRIERVVTELGGRKSLYSTAFYDRDEFFEIYGGQTYLRLKQAYDPAGRLPGLYEKVVRST